MLTERFGWNGPPDGKRGEYDYVSNNVYSLCVVNICICITEYATPLWHVSDTSCVLS